MLVVLSFISQALVVVDTDSYSSAVVEDSSILEELFEQNGARSRTVENATLLKDIVSGGSSSNPQSLFAHTDGNLYFSRKVVTIVTDRTVLKKVQFHFQAVIVLILPLLGIHYYLLKNMILMDGNYIHTMVLQSQ
mgnify:CR=1 FL=1